MSTTAEQGPLITFGQAYTDDTNPQAGPNMWYQGDSLLDPRQFQTYTPGQRPDQPTYGWYSSTAIPLIDQVPSAIAANNIAASQAPTSNTKLTLVSSSGAGITVGTSITNGATGAAVTGLLAIDVAMAPVVFGQGAGSGGPTSIYDPTKSISRTVRITTNADDTGGHYLVAGYDLYGFPQTENILGVNNGVAAGKKAFKYIASVTPTGTINSTAVTVGTGDVFGIPLVTPRFPYTSVWWGTPPGLITGGSVGGQTTLEIPVTLSALANTQQYQLDVPFDGTLVSINFRVTTAATTAAKAATLTAQANGVSVTGGVVSLTSANCTPIGAGVAGTAITAGNTFTAGQTVGFVVSGVTAFVEGAGVVELVVQNSDASGGVFVGADTTSPATATTGDVRGTFQPPSASDGTKRLVLFWTPLVSNMKTTAGLVGVTPA